MVAFDRKRGRPKKQGDLEGAHGPSVEKKGLYKSKRANPQEGTIGGDWKKGIFTSGKFKGAILQGN